MQHFSDGVDEDKTLAKERIRYQLPPSDELEERLDFSMRAERVRQVIG